MSFFEPDAEDRPLVPASERARPLPDDTSLGALFAAGAERMGLISNTIGGELLRERAYDERIDAVFRATGVRLDNPARRYFTSAEAEAELAAAGRPVERAAWRNRDAAMALAAEQFDRRLAELAQERAEDPQAVAAIAAGRPIDEDVRALFNRATADEAAALGAGNINPVVKWGTYLAGGVVGGLRDPINLLGLFIGGPATGTARTIAGAVLRTGIREAVANAGVEALSQPFVAKWRADLGLPVPTLREAATDVGMAALFGGALGSAGEGARQAIRISFPAAARGTGGDGAPPVFPATDTPNAAPRPPETPETAIGRGLAGDDAALIEAVRAAGDAAPPEWRAAADALEADRLIQERAAEAAPPEVAEPLLSAAMRRAEDPEAPLPIVPGSGPLQAVGLGRSVVRSERPRRPPRLVEFLAANGGILDETGELRRADAHRIFVPRAGPLLRRKGLTLDRAREMAAERGYFGYDFGPPEEAMSRTTVADFLNLLQEDMRHKSIYSFRDERDLEAWNNRNAAKDRAAELRSAEAQFDEIDDLRDAVLSPDARRRMIEMAVDERLDFDDALERVLMEDYYSGGAKREGSIDDLGDDIPFDTDGPPQGLDILDRPAAGERGQAGPPGGERDGPGAGRAADTDGEGVPRDRSGAGTQDNGLAGVLDTYPVGASDGLAGDAVRLVGRADLEAEGSRLAELSAAVAACRLF